MGSSTAVRHCDPRLTQRRSAFVSSPARIIGSRTEPNIREDAPRFLGAASPRPGACNPDHARHTQSRTTGHARRAMRPGLDGSAPSSPASFLQSRGQPQLGSRSVNRWFSMGDPPCKSINANASTRPAHASSAPRMHSARHSAKNVRTMESGRPADAVTSSATCPRKFQSRLQWRPERNEAAASTRHHILEKARRRGLGTTPTGKAADAAVLPRCARPRGASARVA